MGSGPGLSTAQVKTALRNLIATAGVPVESTDLAEAAPALALATSRPSHLVPFFGEQAREITADDVERSRGAKRASIKGRDGRVRAQDTIVPGNDPCGSRG